MKIKVWILISVFLCFLSKAISSDTLLIGPILENIDLKPYTSLYIDETGELTFEELLGMENSFTPTETFNFEGPYPTTYWLHYVFRAEKDVKNAKLVMPGDSVNDFFENRVNYMDCYLVNQNTDALIKERSGFYVPHSEKKLGADLPYVAVVPLSLQANEVYDVYIRIQNVFSPQKTYLGLELRNAEAALPLPNLKYRWPILGAWGMFIIIGLYVLVFYYFVRDPSYLYFGFFCLLYSIDMLSIEPEGGLIYFIPEHPLWNVPIFYSHLFSITFLMLFGEVFTDIKNRLPRWLIYYRIALSILFLTTLYCFIRNLWPPYELTPIYFFLSFLLFIPIGIRFLGSRFWEARLFAICFFSFIIGNVSGVYIINAGNEWGVYFWLAGQLILLILFALGLGYKLLESERKKLEGEKIQEMDQLKSQFFTNISHEFRTPLSLILGPINQVEESVPASDLDNPENEVPVKAKHLQIMKRNAFRLQHFIDQILDLSKIESKKMNLYLSQGPIIKFLKVRVAEFENLAQNKGIHLMATYPSELEEAYFDQDKVEKILANILGNALKFTPEKGEIRVNVTIEKQFLNVSISDTGPGLSSSEIDQLFNRFYQSDRAAQQGSGIGMALVKELVELHKGNITVESQEGKGTTIKWSICIGRNQFDFETNALEVFSQIDHPKANLFIDPAAPYVVQKQDTISGDKNLILVVEDHPELQSYIKEILEEKFQVLIAKNGKEGLELAIQHIPDMIISDVMMPEMTGIELCDAIKNEEKTNHIPIILLTAKTDQKDKRMGLNSGANDYLTKPFDAKELVSKIDNLTQVMNQWREKYSKSSWHNVPENLPSMEEQFLQLVLDTIQKNITNEYFSVEELSKEIGYSRSQLFRKLKAITGQNPLDMIKLHRLHYAKSMLEKGVATVSEIAYQVGYSNLSYFSKSFKNEFGMLPSQVRKG